MDKGKILECMRPEKRAITMGGEQVFLSQWNLDASDKIILAREKFSKDEITAGEFFAVVAVLSLCDEAGAPIFTDADIDELAKSSAVRLKEIYRDAMELNSFKIEGDEGEPEKN
jgi:hypothetical protein